MKNRKNLLLSAVLLGTIALSVFADEDELDFDALLAYDESRSFGVEYDWNGPTHLVIEAWREPLVAGTHRITAAAKCKDLVVEPLISIRYLVADDDNGDGQIQLSEYVVMATATAVLEDGYNIARCAPVVVSNDKDAYRIETTFERDGVEFTTADLVIRKGLLDEDGD